MKNRETFIKAMLSQVKNPFVRNSIRNEYMNHIQDLIENELESGLSLEEAEIQAINQLGDPLEIGQSLNQVHNPYFGWLRHITKVLFFILVVFVGVRLIPSYIDQVKMNEFTSKGDYRESFQYFDTLDTKKIDVTTSIGNFDYHFQDILYTEDKRILIYFSYHDNHPNTSSFVLPNLLTLTTSIYINESNPLDLMPVLLPIPSTQVDDTSSIVTTAVRSYKNIGILELRNVENMPKTITIEIFNPDNQIELISILGGGTQ